MTSRSTATELKSQNAVVAEHLAAAATRGERLVSIARAGLCSVALARSIWIWDVLPLHPGQLLITQLSLIALLLAVSLFSLKRCSRGPASLRLLVLSTASDVVIGTAAIALNVSFPGPDQPTLMRMPDTALLILPVVAAGLRLIPGLVVGAGVAIALLLVGLIVLEERLAGTQADSVAQSLTIYLALILAVTAIATLIARRTRQLAYSAARNTVEAERAEQNLGLVLTEHHDLRSLLSSARLNAGWIEKSLTKTPPVEPSEIAGVATRLSEELDEVNEFVSNIRERSHTDLLALRALAPIRLGVVASAVAHRVGLRFSPLAIDLQLPGPPVSVLVAGGSEALDRVLSNLLTNAAEGDGHTGAKRVSIEASRVGERVRILILDDGPGFASALLANGDASLGTTKSDGSGLGLRMVREIVAASGGRFEIGNQPRRGARVCIELSAAPDELGAL